MERCHDLVTEAPYGQVPVHGLSLTEQFSKMNSVSVLTQSSIAHLSSHPYLTYFSGTEVCSRDIEKVCAGSEDPQIEPGTRLSCPLPGFQCI